MSANRDLTIFKKPLYPSTFDEWWDSTGFSDNFERRAIAKAAWNAARIDWAPKVVRGTGKAHPRETAGAIPDFERIT